MPGTRPRRVMRAQPKMPQESRFWFICFVRLGERALLFSEEPLARFTPAHRFDAFHSRAELPEFYAGPF